MDEGEMPKKPSSGEEKSKYQNRKAKYSCTLCDTSCDRFQRLQRHMKSAHDIELDQPVSPAISEKKCAVPGCEFVAANKKVLQAHWRQVHENNKVVAVKRNTGARSSFRQRHPRSNRSIPMPTQTSAPSWKCFITMRLLNSLRRSVAEVIEWYECHA